MKTGDWIRFAAVTAGALLIVLTLAHARAHYRRPRDDEAVEIVQATVSTVTSEMLAERRPIVITDRLAGDPVESLARTVFSWQHVTRSADEPCRMDAFERTRSRFTLVFFDASATIVGDPSVVIKPVGEESYDGVAVVLAVGRVLVLPPGWRFLPLAAGARRACLDDVFTAVFGSTSSSEE